MLLAGAEVPVRPSMGVSTQPISFIGLPVITVPAPCAAMPIGVQIVTTPWREDIAFRIAAHLEAAGIVGAPRPQETAAWN